VREQYDLLVTTQSEFGTSLLTITRMKDLNVKAVWHYKSSTSIICVRQSLTQLRRLTDDRIGSASCDIREFALDATLQCYATTTVWRSKQVVSTE
jgi:hypothetical protein